MISVIDPYLAVSIVYMTLRHYSLWDRRRPATIALWSAFAVTYTTVCVLFVFNLRAFRGKLYIFTFNAPGLSSCAIASAEYSPLTQTCNLSTKPLSLVGTWACMVRLTDFCGGQSFSPDNAAGIRCLHPPSCDHQRSRTPVPPYC